MEKIRSFEDLHVWQKAHQLFLDIALDVDRFPNRKIAGIIANQLLRSASSIGANIAEGFGRHMGREYTHYLIVARGSTTETINWCINCRDLKLVGSLLFEHRRSQLEEILKMLNRMVSQQLKRTSSRSH
jgi:four helix bundle protein